MANVLIVVHLLIVLALIVVILLQRSEGGGLGMGGNTNSLSRARTSANLLSRTTAILGALFFATAIGLTVIHEVDRGSQGILQNAIGTGTAGDGTTQGEQPSNVLDALNRLQGEASGAPDASSDAQSSSSSSSSSPDAPDLAIPGANGNSGDGAAQTSDGGTGSGGN